MSIFYVRKSGNDSNAGTSPAAAWLTIGKALGASGISSGDTVYIGPGVYREQVTVAMTSATAETFVIGDVTGAYTGDAPGEIRLTNYLTNDTTAPTDGTLFDFNGRDYLTISNLVFQSTILSTANLMMVKLTTASSSNITLRDCSFFMNEVSGNSSCSVVKMTLPANVNSNILIERCIFYTSGCADGVFVSLTLPAAADYDAGVNIKNCVFIGDLLAAAVSVAATGVDVGFKAGGAIVRNCSIFYASLGVTTGSFISTSIPCYAYNNIVLHSGLGGAALDAQTSGQLIENYNLLYSSFPHSNVTPGTDSVYDSSYAPLFHTGQESQWGADIRPFGMPSPGSPWLGFGNDGSAPATDILNRPRPAGGQSTAKAVGAYERHDTGVEETSVYDSPPSSMKIVGPGDHDFEIPVNSLAVVNLTVMVRYNGDHGSTNKPQVQVLADSVLGVNAETLTMTEAADTWERLEFSSFTPLGYGVVRLRCISRAAAGNGIAYFDSITV